MCCDMKSVLPIVTAGILGVVQTASGQPLPGSHGEITRPLELLFAECGAELRQLHDHETGIHWLGEASPLWETDHPGVLEARLTVDYLSGDEVALTLEVHNPTSAPIRTDITFPVLHHLVGDDVQRLAYAFPRQDLILGDSPVDLETRYSGRFPLQFVTVYQPGAGGLYLMTCDEALHRKDYFLTKADEVAMGATYTGLTLEAGETLVLPTARLGVYQGDWHRAFDAYRRWVSEWYEPSVARKDWFRRVFSFRQVFLYPNLDTPGLYHPESGTLSIAQAIDADVERFGAVDYVHLFDWSQTPEHGRVGSYAPWRHLPRETFAMEIEGLQNNGYPVGLYFEGYLVSPAAEIEGLSRDNAQLRTGAGGAYDPFGSGDHYLCPGVRAWRDYLTQAVSRVAAQTPADGYYIDQIGFGYQYTCFDPDHGHEVPGNQPRDEARLMREVRASLPPERVLYTEQTPVDVATQYQDGSFSYTLLHARHDACPSRVNLARFAFPDFKTFQILRGDGPIGDDVQGVKLAFFNGEGLWLVGPSDDERWFSRGVLDAIRRSHSIMRTHADAFTSTDVTPLVPTEIQGVYANRFAGSGRTVWTVYNATDYQLTEPVLRLPHEPGDRYFDLWRDEPIQPTVDGQEAVIALTLDAGDVGAVLQDRGEDRNEPEPNADGTP